MQSKATIRHFYATTGMSKIKKTDNTKWWWGCGATGIFIYSWWKYRVNAVWQFLKTYGRYVSTVWFLRI